MAQAHNLDEMIQKRSQAPRKLLLRENHNTYVCIMTLYVCMCVHVLSNYLLMHAHNVINIEIVPLLYQLNKKQTCHAVTFAYFGSKYCEHS